MAKKIPEAQLIAELEALPDIQQRIDRVGDDLSSGAHRYAPIDACALAELLGVELGDAGRGAGWDYMIYVYREHPGDDYPLAANVGLLEGHVSKKRYKQLVRLAEDILERESGDDLPLTTKEEEHLRDAYHEEHAGGEGITIASICLRSSKDQELRFEAALTQGEADGDVWSPYDLAQGKEFDSTDYVPA